MVKSDLQLVPETVLKKRHQLDELARKQAASISTLARQRGKNRGKKFTKDGKAAFYVKKPEKIVARARRKRNHERRFNRVMKKGMQKRASNKKVMATKEIDVSDDDDDEEGEENNGGVQDASNEKDGDRSKKIVVRYQANSVGAPMVFAVRIKDHYGVPKPVERVLSKLRLQNIHDGVFVRYDDERREMLHLVEPWVVYGRPTKAVVADLVMRRGHGRGPGGERFPLSDNVVVEEALGDSCNVICVEDLVHELHAVGENFDEVSKFLWPFKLADSKSEFERKTLKLKDGKDYGDKGEAINEYIRQVI